MQPADRAGHARRAAAAEGEVKAAEGQWRRQGGEERWIGAKRARDMLYATEWCIC